MLFRGYPLQTLTRANLAWLESSSRRCRSPPRIFEQSHVVPGLTFLKRRWRRMAGVRLPAHRRCGFRSDMHWSWNWAQVSLLGLPVSGINRIAPAPLLHAMNSGPDWLTGGVTESRRRGLHHRAAGVDRGHLALETNNSRERTTGLVSEGLRGNAWRPSLTVGLLIRLTLSPQFPS